jgi:predicted nucleotidyltransferase
MQTQDSRRGFRDRDFIRTKEGFFFCVVGPYHPADRVFAYVKYVPAKMGKWKNKRTSYKRVMRAYTIPNLLQTFNLLKTKHPQYLFYSEVYGITMTAVPHGRILQHYKPEEKLAKILKIKKKDALQTKLANFVGFVSSKSGVASNNFGITGSILLDIHNPKFSDMDVTIYGLSNSLKVKEALTRAYIEPNSSVRRFEGALLDDWFRKKAERFPLSLRDARRIYEHKWNLGVFEDVMFSVHPAQLEIELAEKYGDKTFRPEGHVILRALVADDSESLFLPCVYRVRDVKVIEGKHEGVDATQVVSYESLYDGLATIGEEIVVKGKLERVHDNRDGTEHYRVLVGSPEGKGEEYIKPID